MNPAPPLICNWRAPSAALSVACGQLDIWLLELDKAPCQPEWLDAAETARLNRFRPGPGHQQYCCTHSTTRLILGRYLDCAAADVPLKTNPGGKPRIDRDPPPLYFNLSHAGNIALLALRAGHRLGIDIENSRDLPNIAHLGRRAFREDEIARLEQSRWNSDLFFELWTRMEARQKCLGRGVFGEAVGGNLVETRPINLEQGQFAAIAWPTGTAPNRFNFYSASTII